MLTRAIVLSVTCSAFAFGCSEPMSSEDEQKEIVDNLKEAGFPADDIMVVDGKVYVGRDSEVSLEASREMLDTSSLEEQYRTTNLVGTGVTRICVNPTAAFNAATNFSAALNGAIAAYTNQPLRFDLVRGPTTGCNANIAARTTGGTGGSAGFPSGGLPFNNINIGTGLTGFPLSTIRHVIIHELGHTVGFRHSDFFNRSISCGSGGSEGSAGVGAIHIPGTPTGAAVGQSVMNSCFRSNEAGAFTGSDVTAINTLY